MTLTGLELIAAQNFLYFRENGHFLRVKIIFISHNSGLNSRNRA